MKNELPTPEEFRRMEYEFNEQRDMLPEELSEVMSNLLEAMRGYATQELPSTVEFIEAFEEFMSAHYPELKMCKEFWQRGWIKEVIEENSSEMGTSVFVFFDRMAKGEDVTEDFNDFNSTIEMYLKNEPPAKCIVDATEYPELSADQLKIFQESYDEEYLDELEYYEEMRPRKLEFRKTMQSIIFKYYEEQTHNLSLPQWQYYGIMIAMAFDEFHDNCLDLINYLVSDERLTSFPEMGFYEYRAKEWDKITAR
ncbi:MAG: hypothetical protein QM751_02455 [Paludibacteraceae bacterium]